MRPDDRRRPVRATRGVLAVLALATAMPLALGACTGSGGGGGSEGPIVVTGPLELVSCQSDEQRPYRLTEILHSSVQGLDQGTQGSRTGQETHVRVHPDGNRIVFARQRDIAQADSREIYVDYLDRSQAEQRLTGNGFVDDSPCWSSDGSGIFYSSDIGGTRHIWHMDADGQNPVQITAGNVDDRDPDARGGFVYFSRTETVGSAVLTRIVRMNENGSNPTVLTDGGGLGGADRGDREPAISPDQRTLLFSRLTGDETATLMARDMLLGQAVPLSSGAGADRWPRWSPQGDRVFVARSRPALGRPGLRLYQLAPDGGGALLIYPDQRMYYPGFDPLPNLAAFVPPDPTVLTADLDRGELVIRSPGVSRGGPGLMEDADDLVFGLATGAYEGREVAAVQMRLELPIDADTQLLKIAEIQFKVRAAITRTDPGSVIRLAMRNFVNDRFDTAVQLAPTDTDLHDYEFRTSSLAHVDSIGRVVVEVVGDLDPGNQAELLVDLFEVQIRVRP